MCMAQIDIRPDSAEVPDPLFKIEDRGNGYRFLAAPDFPGFDAHYATISAEGYDPAHCDCPVLNDAHAAIAKATGPMPDRSEPTQSQEAR